MGPCGGYELSRRLSLGMRQREIVIGRFTARCGCEYEWGVHVTFFADAVASTEAQVRSLTLGTPDDYCWAADEAALIRAVDELHDTSTVSDPTWPKLTAFLDERQLLDLLLLAGWCHAISFAANAARVPLEGGAARFDDFR